MNATASLKELDALHRDMIVRRWQLFTGKKAERLAAVKVAT
jgi:hypothetical protein